MSEDLKWELTILEVVHGFYLNLLQETLGENVLLPDQVDACSLHSPEVTLSDSVAQLRRWLRLLDMAVTPAMLREALTADIDQDLSEALLRYYASKRSQSDFDRDKAGFIATFLYRNPRVPGQWMSHGYSLDGVAPVPPFEIALLEVLGDIDLPDLTAEHERTLLELEELETKVRSFTNFEQIMDSSVIPRARMLKHDLGDSLFHPHVLARIAAYNEAFGKHFDELFRKATAHIKAFAAATQRRGVNASVRIHEDVTLHQLVGIEAQRIQRTEYIKAQEQFRHVARLKKAIDAKIEPATQAATLTMQDPRPTQQSAIANQAVTFAAKPANGHPVTAVAPAAPPTLEEGKLKAVEHSIQSFVRAANPKFRQIVPMKFGNLTLSAAEADAYCADYLTETSFRADNARVLTRLVALLARVSSELEELKQRQASNHLWRVHGESLHRLAEAARTTISEAQGVIATAQQRGLIEKVNALNASIGRLQEKLIESNAMLQILAARSAN